jgi:nucleotide-binding universal stress UspA family protein
MESFKKILCPVDFSDYSDLTIRYGVALAAKYRASLLIFHAVPDMNTMMGFPERIPPVREDLREEATRRLKNLAAREVPPQIECECLVQTGIPAKTILTVAEEKGADLIVMGTHGRSGYEKFLLGSVSYKVIHKSMVPVLVVRKAVRSIVGPDEKTPVVIKKILCPIDLGPASRKIFEAAETLAHTHEAELFLMHVCDNQKQTSVTTDQLNGYIQSIPKASVIVEVGHPAEKIVQTSDVLESNLIVMGHHTRLPFENWFLGSVAFRVIADAACPVLLLRG